MLPSLSGVVRLHVVRPKVVGGPVRICGFRVFCSIADTSYLHAVGEGLEMGEGTVIFGKYEFWNHN
jgi:hypothetical protein